MGQRFHHHYIKFRITMLHTTPYQLQRNPIKMSKIQGKLVTFIIIFHFFYCFIQFHPNYIVPPNLSLSSIILYHYRHYRFPLLHLEYINFQRKKCNLIARIVQIL